MIENRDLESIAPKRGLSLSDVPHIIRQGDGSQLSEIPRMSNKHICNVIRQWIEVKEVESSAQILNNVLEGSKLKIAALPNQGEEEIREFGDFVDE